MLIPILISLVSIIIGLFVFFKPDLTIGIQRRFYEKINWRIEPISMSKEIRNTKIMGISLVAAAIVTIIYYCFVQSAFAGQSGRGSFDKYINNDTNGSSFQEAVVLPDICDYSKCKTKDCLIEVFDKTVFGQELKYVLDNYGQRGEDWDISGFDVVDSYVFDEDKYYDDLGIEIMGTGENKVLHFDITASVNALRQQQFSL